MITIEQSEVKRISDLTEKELQKERSQILHKLDKLKSEEIQLLENKLDWINHWTKVKIVNNDKSILKEILEDYENQLIITNSEIERKRNIVRKIHFLKRQIHKQQ